MTSKEHATRLDALRGEMHTESMYVSAMPNIRYLTGFSGGAGQLLVTRDEAILFTDGRYRSQAHQQTSGIDIEISPADSRIAFAKAVKDRAIRSLGFEENRLGYHTYSFLGQEVPGCELVPLDSAVEKLRMRKSPMEIEAIRRSAALNSRAFEDVCGRIQQDWTEARIAAELEFSMRRLGAEGAAFPTIVASGPHGALPHAEPRDRVVNTKSLVVVDLGAIVGGYCSDMTRMISLGQPHATQKALFEPVLAAQAAAIGAIRAGVECQSVDRQARLELRGTSVRGVRLDTAFTHSTGHGLGLEIHEAPRVAPRQRRRLQAGMVVTVEPGVYLEGLAGVRIEDVVVVTEDGCEVLTSTSRALRIL